MSSRASLSQQFFSLRARFGVPAFARCFLPEGRGISSGVGRQQTAYRVCEVLYLRSSRQGPALQPLKLMPGRDLFLSCWHAANQLESKGTYSQVRGWPLKPTALRPAIDLPNIG